LIKITVGRHLCVATLEARGGAEPSRSFFSSEEFLTLAVRKVGASILELRIGHEELDTGFREPGSLTRGFYYLKATPLFRGSNFAPNSPKGLFEFLGGFVHRTHFKYRFQDS
jgi:hypothetical protein